MRLFISWSGKASHAVALALRDWIPLILQPVSPWVSSEDVEKGSRWSHEIGENLNSADAGIVCVTRENATSAWINFEAGALSRSVTSAAVWTLLTQGVTPEEVEGPLAQFQHTRWERDDLRRLLRDINSRLGEAARSQDQLSTLFEQFWPALEARVKNALSGERPTKSEVRLSELAQDSDILAGRTFENAIIRGPAVVFLESAQLEHCIFEYNMTVESILWPLDTQRTPAIVGAIGLHRCRFVGCTFRGIGFVGTNAQLDLLRRLTAAPAP